MGVTRERREREREGEKYKLFFKVMCGILSI
jgi:hypothetical protein